MSKPRRKMVPPPAGPENWPPNSFAARVPVKDLGELLDGFRQVDFEPKDVVMYEGDAGSSVALVLSGQLKVETRDSQGRTHLLGLLGRGDLLGEMAILDRRPRSASVIALGAGSYAEVSGARFLELVRERPGTSLEIARLVSARLRAAERRRLDFAAYQGPWRLASELVNLASVFRGAGQDQTVRIELTQDELAQILNVSRISVQRAIRTLRERRLVSTRYGALVVPCVTCLTAAMTDQSGNEPVNGITGCSGTRSHG
ncbi:Crp/Fnr family transcriptional regulator [Lentzea sp. CC55]|uniref:Crp/Fnr family transcriptional regulator n=1 Tax=Lentzea sp. CC55 TaxID=2884909 RepID=UPI001F309BEA|nr:Crp/Fnr family transcriptional regulator [Lentzea sp. CC55]MCG8924853.1 Crp/Fnr family transcriptional regulator [Lentzea sp. CC55]